MKAGIQRDCHVPTKSSGLAKTTTLKAGGSASLLQAIIRETLKQVQGTLIIVRRKYNDEAIRLNHPVIARLFLLKQSVK